MKHLHSPIFLVGHPRSGTTLLQCMLSAHSRLTSLPETHFFSRGLYQLGLPPTAELSPAEVGRLLELLNERLPLDVERLRSALDTTPPPRPREVFEKIAEAYGFPENASGVMSPGAPGRPPLRLLEKTPIHALHMPRILAAFPDAVFIHLVRDPRDVIRSALAMPIAFSQWIPFYIRSWNQVQAAVDRFSAEHPERVFTLKYEDLASDPRTALHPLCTFFGLDFEDSMVDSFAGEYERNVNQDAEDWKSGVQHGEIKSSAGKWRESLAPGEAWLIETGCRRWMTRHGYAQHSKATGLQKAKALVRSILVGLRERRRPLHWLHRFTIKHFTSHPEAE